MQGVKNEVKKWKVKTGTNQKKAKKTQPPNRGSGVFPSQRSIPKMPTIKTPALFTKEKETEQALKIACRLLVRAGVCRYDDVVKCKRYFPMEEDCTKCIERFCRARADKEIKKQAADK